MKEESGVSVYSEHFLYRGSKCWPFPLAVRRLETLDKEYEVQMFVPNNNIFSPYLSVPCFP